MESREEDKNIEGTKERSKGYDSIMKPKKPLIASGKFWSVILVIISVTLVFGYLRCWSPAARVKAAFMRGVDAFERKDFDYVMEFISDSYEDSAGNTKESFEYGLDAMFNNADGFRVKINDLKIDFSEDLIAELNGRVSITIMKDKIKTPVVFNEKFTVFMTSKDGKWRLLSIEGVNAPFGDYMIDDF